MLRFTRVSRRVVAAVVSMVLAALGLTVGQPQASASAEPFGAADTVSYPLRHSFSMAVGLPGAGRHEPTSCWDTDDGKYYLCRIVSGYEETGDRQNFVIAASDVLDNGADPRFGHELISRGGVGYEGCRQWRNGDWFCDYATRKQVSREHYEAGRWVLRVLWRWQKYTGGQLGCAGALSALWSGPTGKAFLGFLRSCQNGPLSDPLE